ncbi:MAG TPA: SPOR domain-containing protein [Brevundimonas sp.]
MSHEDPYRPDRDRGAYTPPTDDDLPFRRQGGGPRNAGGGGGKAPPVTLIVSAGVLLVLIIAVVLFYRSGLRSSTDAPPAVGTPVGQLKVEAPIDAQPIDPAEGVDVYDRGAATGAEAPTFVPPPETVQPRPTTPAPTTPTAPVVTPAPKEKTETPAPARPVAGVQIGAFSTPGIADREYAAILGRYPQLTGGASKRVQEVTASNGSTVYRTTVTGISAENARALCGAIRASGGDCIVR